MRAGIVTGTRGHAGFRSKVSAWVRTVVSRISRYDQLVLFVVSSSANPSITHSCHTNVTHVLCEYIYSEM